MLLLVAIACVGCGTAATRAAKNGDQAALRSAIAERHEAGKIDDAEAAEIARLVLSSDIGKAPASEVASRIRDVRACARQIEDVLAERAKVHDEAGAEAALALLDSGAWDADDARAWVSDPDDAWRAVGAHALVRKEDRPARIQAMLDPAPRVRRGAMRASMAAKDPDDLDVLFDAARRDPEPMVKTDAVRAIASVVTDAQAALTVTRLRDLYGGADDALKEDIANAWAMPVLANGGGAQALRVLLASAHGPGAISGAAAVLRAKPGTFDADTRASALALVVRAIDSGAHRDQMFAIAVAPLSDVPAIEALRRASEAAHDLDLRLAALARLVDSPADRARAIQALESFGSPLANPRMGPRARMVLAAAGDARIQAWIEKDLTSDDPHTRLFAARALISLRRAARSAPLLGDKDVSVRTRAACMLLSSARNPG